AFWAYPGTTLWPPGGTVHPVLGTDHELIRSPRRARDHAGTWRHRGRLLPRGGVVLALRFPRPLTQRSEPLAVPTFGADQCIAQRSQTAPTCPAWHEPAPSLLHLSWNPSYVYYTGFDTEKEPIMASIC